MRSLAKVSFASWSSGRYPGTLRPVDHRGGGSQVYSELKLARKGSLNAGRKELVPAIVVVSLISLCMLWTFTLCMCMYESIFNVSFHFHALEGRYNNNML